jgi:hypothetical protein
VIHVDLIGHHVWEPREDCATHLRISPRQARPERETMGCRRDTVENLCHLGDKLIPESKRQRFGTRSAALARKVVLPVPDTGADAQKL